MSIPVHAERVIIYFRHNGEYLAYACSQDVFLDATLETKSVKTIGDGPNEKVRGQKKSKQITLSGLVLIDEDVPTSFDLLSYHENMTDIEFRLVFEDTDTGNIKVIEGVALPININTGGGSSGFATGNITLQVNGEVDIREDLETCDLEVTSFIIDSNGPIEDTGLSSYDITPAITGDGELLRYEYAIDGGGRLLGGYSSPFNIAIAPGSYQLTIWPVCTNGLDGTPVTGEANFV